MEETIELKELFLILKKRLWLIASLATLGLGISGGVSLFLLTPIYQSYTQIIVNSAQQENQITNQDIQTSINLINTYRTIIESPRILNEVIENLDLDYTATQVAGMITVNSANNSQVFSISVRNSNPHVAADIANQTAEVFQTNIGSLMNVENSSILTPAVPGDSPVEPRPPLNMAIGLIVGAMLGVGLAFVMEYLDTRIKSEQEIEKLIGVPVLGAVPHVSAKDFKKH